ncbi:MAG: tyrosine-type recombinase/integrase [Clostridia bacterium]|nr:tyrosine-type recombinase/integrase [Clostridia bacterium]
MWAIENQRESSPYDFRSTFATQFKEMGVSSAQVADLMGHADSRMVETVYARTRHESVMSQKDMIESLNSDYIIGPGVVPIQSSSNCDMPMVAG